MDMPAEREPQGSLETGALGEAKYDIIVVDDDPAMRSGMRQVLTAAGYGVGEAANGTEVLALLARASTRLVITDIFMPNSDGLEVIQILLRRNVPVIAMSGAPHFEVGLFQRVSLHLGARAALQKPFSDTELLQRVTTEIGPPGSRRQGGA